MSGKSTLSEQIIANADELFDPPPQTIVYAYGEYDVRIHNFQKIGAIVVAGLPADDFLATCKKPILLFLDDLMTVAKESYLVDLYTKKMHHQNLAVFFLSQNLYDKAVKVARMNSQYIFLMRSASAALHARILGSQLFPGQQAFFADANRKATHKPYKYLMIDMHPTTPNELRLRADIMPGEEQTVFLPRTA